MTAQLPAPLVPPEVDLRGLEYMPFFGHHLLGSEFNSKCDDAAWRVGVTLWWKSWNQVPAASLPTDDPGLMKLAELGRDSRTWNKVKKHALHGFVLCSDGRYYHRFLAAQALIAWEKRVKERKRKQAWREGKSPRSEDGDNKQTEQGQGRGQVGSVPGYPQGTERLTGRDVTGRDVTLGSNNTSASINAPTRRGEMARALRDQGVHGVTPAHPQIVAWVEAGVSEQLLRDAVSLAREEKPHPERIPMNYLISIVERLRTQPASHRWNGEAAPARDTTCGEILEGGKRCGAPGVFGNALGTSWRCREHEA